MVAAAKQINLSFPQRSTCRSIYNSPTKRKAKMSAEKREFQIHANFFFSLSFFFFFSSSKQFVIAIGTSFLLALGVFQFVTQV